MDVFLSDPLLDWLRAPSKCTRQTSGFCYVEGGRAAGREGGLHCPPGVLHPGGRQESEDDADDETAPGAPKESTKGSVPVFMSCLFLLLTLLCPACVNCLVVVATASSVVASAMHAASLSTATLPPSSLTTSSRTLQCASSSLGPRYRRRTCSASCFARLSTIRSHTRASHTMFQLFRVARGPSDGRRRAAENNVSVAGDDAGTRCANVTEQVECLVELATDPSMLVRQWVGLATWV